MSCRGPLAKLIVEPGTLDDRALWVARGACRNRDDVSWFAEGVEGGAQRERREAIRICDEECPVRAQCLAWALAHEEYGIWGGTSERERKRMRKTLRIFVESPQRLTGEIRSGMVGVGGPSLGLFASIGDPHFSHLGEIA